MTEELTQSLKQEALALGFAGAGVCLPTEPHGLSQLDQWLERGYAGEMDYFKRRRAAYEHPRNVLGEVAAIVVLATSYQTIAPTRPAAGQGRISRYAFSSRDYHDILHQRTQCLADYLKQRVPAATCRCVVDTAPLMERELATRAGLGWQGKNTLVLSRKLGSWFFLSALLTDQALVPDQPFATDHCGSCTACLEACPTDAFVQPNLLDATRCISYLTIEHRSAIPRELRESIGDWLFGCDVCQDVCPWNRKLPSSADAAFEPDPAWNPMELAGLFELDEAGFRARFRNSPLWRTKRRGLLRNAAIVLGNQRCIESGPALATGLQDAEPVVRGAAAWALGRLSTEAARNALRERQPIESDDEVIEEITLALNGL